MKNFKNPDFWPYHIWPKIHCWIGRLCFQMSKNNVPKQLCLGISSNSPEKWFPNWRWRPRNLFPQFIFIPFKISNWKILAQVDFILIPIYKTYYSSIFDKVFYFKAVVTICLCSHTTFCVVLSVSRIFSKVNKYESHTHCTHFLRENITLTY